MAAQAGSVQGKTKDEALRTIKQDLLLGCDIDPWIAVIAKMNMYIHGDGKSNIRHANGLTIATTPTFEPHYPGRLVEALDVVVTNPPLGDINFVTVAEQVARAQAEAEGADSDPNDLRRRAAEWSNANLAVVPHKIVEEDAELKAAKKADEWREKAAQAKASGDARAEARARLRVEEWEAKRKEANKALGSGDVQYQPSGRTAKGGALFMSAIIRSLKKKRDASLPIEWSGGMIGLIIDEAVLNTREYAQARAFLRNQYFLKAVVSLPRDAFADLAKTTAKTSILLLVRKEDPDVSQREPVFFARAELTGPTAGDLKRRDVSIGIQLGPLIGAQSGPHWRAGSRPEAA